MAISSIKNVESSISRPDVIRVYWRMVILLRRLYYFLLAFPAQRELQYLVLLSNVVKTLPQIEHFFSMITIQQTS
jgi:hypothetical protein